MKPIRLFWCRGSGRDNAAQQNFGDYLSADIVEFVSGRKVEHASIRRADMIAIGSVLGREKKAKTWGFPRKLHIWGTGSGNPDDVFSGRHHFHAVRGTKCLSQIRGKKVKPVLGDPGLLSASLVNKPIDKCIRVGLIPHIRDRKNTRMAELLTRIPGAKVIDVYSPVKQVLAEIASCDFVLSTSLHGLIVADSYGVPNQWLSTNRCPRWEYKFQDYYTSFGFDNPAPLTVDEILLDQSWTIDAALQAYARPGLDDMKQALVKAFPDF
ncbi:polysaccharide pyruvyl transferase family protein [Pseudomonas putida]|uniref:polysaccharide pyruvyl transferase family protein n=1 Tax=Pseudomonas putida TaxID=303 RepID=UPI0037C5DB65